MNLPLILITHRLPKSWLTLLQDQVRFIMGPENATSISKEIYNHMGETEGILCLLTIRIDGELLERMPNLRVISNMAVGVDNIDLNACKQRGIPVGHTPGVLTDATADLTMGLLLMAARRLPEASRDASEGRWHTWSPTNWLGKDLTHAVLGIVGLGKIGRAVAKRALGFGMRVIYSDTAKTTDDKGCYERVSWEELLHRSDFVSIHCPLTHETQGLINGDSLRAMKSSAILINAARGAIVDTTALTLALRERWISGAALDVTDPEPLPPNHPLYSLPNCIVVPHIGSATEGTRKRMAELACKNLLAGLSGIELPHCVNPEVYTSLSIKD